MARHNGTSAKVWLAVLNEGGRVSAKEAAKLLPETDVESVRGNLNAMVESGTLQKFEPALGRNGARFGVTPACKVPHGVIIGEVLEAMKESAQEVE